MRLRPAILLTLIIAAPLAAAMEDDPDVRTLTSAGISTDPARLCATVRRFSPSVGDEERISQLIKKLSAPGYETRESASLELIDLGPKALPNLKIARSSDDPETGHRADSCIRRIESVIKPHIVAATVRVLGRSKHPDAAAALLDGIVAVDDAMAEEWLAALGDLARPEGPPPTAFHDALHDKNPIRRAASAKALMNGQQRQALTVVRPLLNDPVDSVRFAVGVAMVELGERDGMAAIIAALPGLTRDQLFEADEFLGRIAGDKGPIVQPGTTTESRKQHQAEWQKWWSAHEATADLSPASLAARAGGILVAAANGTPGSAVLEVNFQGPGNASTPERKFTISRRIDKLDYPVAVEALGRGRVLIAELRGGKVTERDFKGNVYWEKSVPFPVACQRVPGGGCFIAARNEIMLVNRDGSERYRFDVNNVAAAVRRRDGSIVVVSNNGSCQIYDEAGAVRSGFPIGSCLTISSVQSLPGERLLIPSYAEDRVYEYNAAGKAVWYAEFRKPNSAYRLPNGNTICCSQIDGRVGEIDRQGRIVREFRTTEGLRPWGAGPTK